MAQTTSGVAPSGEPRPVRVRILDAARDAVRYGGIEAVRMEDVADRAGVARPNLYRYFSSRDALVKEVLLAEIRTIHEKRRARLARVTSAREQVIESLVMGAEQTRSTQAVTAVDGPGLDGVARLVASDDDLMRVEAEYWHPLLARARATGTLVDHLTDDRIIRWFMTCHFLVATQPDIVPADVRTWIEDFVAPPVLGPRTTTAQDGTDRASCG